MMIHVSWCQIEESHQGVQVCVCDPVSPAYMSSYPIKGLDLALTCPLSAPFSRSPEVATHKPWSHVAETGPSPSPSPSQMQGHALMVCDAS